MPIRLVAFCVPRRSRTRAKYVKKKITNAALKKVEDEEIKKLIKKQEAISMRLAADGEYRRWWHYEFLEYDSDRAGGFEPLRFVPKGNKRVVLGLITSKRRKARTPDCRTGAGAPAEKSS